MFRKCAARTYYALLLTLALSLLGCSGQEEPIETTDEADDFVKAEEVVVLSTDSDDWRVRLFHDHLLYSEAAAVQLPALWVIPSREEAQVLKKCNYPNGERFVTSDGYTFAMPSSSVSKAGSKTRYAVLGLQIRKTVIDIGF